VYWEIERHDRIVQEFKRIGFKTGDFVCIDIDANDKPTVCRH
jgi:ubiquinone/menaquinone biosynthesis C-methylase UbiE